MYLLPSLWLPRAQLGSQKMGSESTTVLKLCEGEEKNGPGEAFPTNAQVAKFAM